MKKMLFIFNPHAGKAKIKTSLAGIIDTFNKVQLRNVKR